MRALQLARVAAEAEGLRLRYTTRRNVVRAVLGVTALCLLLGAIILCHAAAWFRLTASWGAPIAALVLAGTDLVIAAALGLVAARCSAGHIEADALALRRRALDHATNSLTVSALAVPLLPLAIRLFRRR
jgi:hypothetical protein